MYPQQELTRLAAHKAVLRQRIATRRAQGVALAGRALQPLAWADRALALWRRFAPLAGLALVPLGLALRRPPGAPSGWLDRLRQWGPAIVGTVRAFRGAFANARPEKFP